MQPLESTPYGSLARLHGRMMANARILCLRGKEEIDHCIFVKCDKCDHRKGHPGWEEGKRSCVSGKERKKRNKKCMCILKVCAVCAWERNDLSDSHLLLSFCLIFCVCLFDCGSHFAFCFFFERVPLQKSLDKHPLRMHCCCRSLVMGRSVGSAGRRSADAPLMYCTQ